MDDINHTHVENILVNYNVKGPVLKICYIILTCEKYIDTRVKWQKQTCFSNTDLSDCYYLSCKNIGESIYGWDTEDDYKSCIIKYIKFFQNMDLEYDWYMFIDDDTFVFPKRVEKYLGKFDCNDALYIGFVWSHIEGLRFMSGGAGFFFTKSTYKLMKNFLLKKENTLLRTIKAPHNGDATVGVWIREINRNNKYCIKLLSDNRQLNINHSENMSDVLNSVTFHYINDELLFKKYNRYLEVTDINLPSLIKIDNPNTDDAISITPVGYPTKWLRHSYFRIFLHEKDHILDDYIFNIRAVSNSDISSVLLESLNYKKNYIVQNENGLFIDKDYLEKGCWKIEQMTDIDVFSFKYISKNPKWNNCFLTVPESGTGRFYLTTKTEGIRTFNIYLNPTL